MSKRKVSGNSPQRQAFVRVMEMKGLSPRTQEAYLRTIRALAQAYDCAPHLLSGAQVSDWITKRIRHGLHQRTTNADISALRLFYRDAMKRPEMVEDLWCRRVPDRLPRVIPQEAIDLLLQGISDRRYRMATLLAYGAGLRISEVVALQVADIKSDLGLIRIRNGKGGHERMAHLPDAVLDALRRYWKTTFPRPKTWLFYQRSLDRPITVASLAMAFNAARERTGVLDSSITFHVLRHACATHLLEAGVDKHIVQDILGHKSIETTRIYARTTCPMFRKLDHPASHLATLA